MVHGEQYEISCISLNTTQHVEKIEMFDIHKCKILQSVCIQYIIFQYIILIESPKTFAMWHTIY